MAIVSLYNALRDEKISLAWPRYVVSAWRPRAIRDEQGDESMEIEIHGLDEGTVYARYERLQMWLGDAREATAENRRSPVRITHNPTGRGERWARIVEGELEPGEYLEYTSHGMMLQALFSFTREQARGAEISLPLTNVHGSNVGDGLQVDNGAESALNNWVSISADDVDGDLPAPFRLAFQNSYDYERRLRHLWYGIRHKSTGPTHGAFMRDAAEAVQGLPLYENADYNQERILEGSGTQVGVWQFPTLSARQWEGTWRVFAVGWFMADAYTLTAKALQSDLPPTLTKTLSQTGAELLDMGVMELPPWPKVEPPNTSYLFEIELASSNGNSILDYLLFLPVDLGFRHVHYTGYNAQYGQWTVDDGINLETAAHYTARAGTIILGEGEFPRLTPARDQRVYFLQRGDLGDVLKQRKLTVRVEYAPRYALL